MSSVKEVGYATRGIYHPLAQLEERNTPKVVVGGSSPSRMT